MSSIHAVPSEPSSVTPTPFPAETSASSRPAVHTAPFTHGKVDQSAGAYRAEWTVAVILVAALACSDIVLIASTWNSVLLDQAWVSWVLGVLTALGAAALMWSAGQHAVIAAVHRFRIHATLACALVIAWMAVGAGITWLRWNAAALTSTQVTTEGQSSTEATSVATHQVLAVVLLSLYVLPGVLAFGHGYKLSNPIAAFQRATFAELSRLAGLIAHLTARRDELTELLTRHENELAQVQANANTAKAAATALAAELRAHARTEMHRSLGDPATGGMTAALTATTDPEHTS